MTHFPAVRRALFAALALLGLTATARSAAVISHTINYQGFLTDTATGLPIDTGKDMQFAIYSAATGGSLLFTESRCASGNARVTVSKGRYQVELGSTTANGIPASVFNGNANAWLEVRVDPDNNCAGFDVLTPRVRLQSAPYAFQSAYSSTASWVVGGYADIGTSLGANPPAPPLRVSHISGSNSTQNIAKFRRESDTGISANGMGARAYFEMPNDGGIDQQVAAVSAVMTDVVAGQEKGSIVFETLDGSGGGPLERVWMDWQGYVGISTNSPASKLHVKDGDIQISTTTGSRGVIYQDGVRQTRAAFNNVTTAAIGGGGPIAGGVVGCGGQGTIFPTATAAAAITPRDATTRIQADAYIHLNQTLAFATSVCVELCAGSIAPACPCNLGAPATSISVGWTAAGLGAAGGDDWEGASLNALFNPAALGIPAGALNVWLCMSDTVATGGVMYNNGRIILTEVAP